MQTEIPNLPFNLTGETAGVQTSAAPPDTSPLLFRRARATVQRELDGVEGDLSPENLTCDGEADPRWVRRRQTQLLQRRTALLRELKSL